MLETADAQMVVGAALIVLWSAARIAFWWMARRRTVTRSGMTPRRRLLLVLVSLSLSPIYVYYFTPALSRFSLDWPLWIGALGDALLAASVALFVWSHLSLGINWTANVDVAQGQQMVTTGPYRWVRHPMYSSFILMSAALLLATANLVVALPFGVTIMAMYADRVAAEEEMMTQEFGDEYARYMSRTGRLLPRFSALDRRRT